MTGYFLFVFFEFLITCIFFQLNADQYEAEGKLKEIREEREYSYSDLIEINEKLPEYEKKVITIHTENIWLRGRKL